MKINILLLFIILCIGCKPSYEEPIISLSDYEIEDGFNLKVVASEPLIASPVALDFDNKGRVWVVEMPGFMNTLEGVGEEEPTGTIKILEDLDKDGVMDHSKIFIDSLVLPRSIALVYGGLLYAAPPNLWFVEINDDIPGDRILVDSDYAVDGNPEHQPNGLKLNIDNWIYSAKSSYRYKRENGEWLKEPTSFRGQWGITHDNFGRLYYNNNSKQLLGDYVLPNRFITNKFYTPKHSINQLLTKDQRVYPIHASSVNRGYAKNVLNKDSLLVNVTATCGPLIYRGNKFPKDYFQNAFVCVPEANLIKRNMLFFKGDNIIAKQAWEGKEFLASKDEGFRPVNLSNGLDGSMYIVDMHLGVIQHYAFLSPYLRKMAKQKRLDTIVNMGRILKVTHKNNTIYNTINLDVLSNSELVPLLKNENGSIRDRAQHMLIYKDAISEISKIEKIAIDVTDSIAQVHALYTLKGLSKLKFSVLKEVLKNSSSMVASHSIVLLEDFISKEKVAEVVPLFNYLQSKTDKSIDLYMSATIGKWLCVSNESFLPLFNKLAHKYRNNDVYTDAFLSGFENINDSLVSLMRTDNKELLSLIEETIVKKEKNKLNPIFANKIRQTDSRTKGSRLFSKICAACHGITGEGIDGLAPPLVASEYVSHSSKRLGLIILHGLEGPVHVNGKLYKMNHVMPGLLNNENISDKDITDLISYVTSAFSDYPREIKTKEIVELRKLKSKTGKEYTESELLKY